MSLMLTQFFLTALLFSGDADLSDRALVEQAEVAFSEGVRLRDNAENARPHFRQAVLLYEELRRRGIANPLLYRNLGNAYLLADDLPSAILSYRQGLRLAPGDRNLFRCLQEARDLVVYPAGSSLGRPRQEYRPPWLPWLPPLWLFAGTVLLYLACCTALTRWLMIRRSSLLIAGLAAFLGGSSLAVVLLDWQRQELAEVETPLVVIADDGVLLRKGNNLSFPPRWETHVNKGVEARLLFERGDWLQIRLAGGEIGWVPRKLVLVDQPQ